MYKRSAQGWKKHLDFIILDAICLQIAYILAYRFRHGSFAVYQNPDYRTMALFLLVVDILIAVALNTMHNVLKRGPYQELVQTVKQSVLVLAGVSIYLFVIHEGETFSRITMVTMIPIHIVISYIVRMIWKRLIKKYGGHRGTRDSIIIAAEEDVIAELHENFRQEERYEITGLIITNRDAKGEKVEGLKVVANVDDAGEYLRGEWIDAIFVQQEEHSAGRLLPLIERCREMGITVHLSLPMSDMEPGGKVVIEKLGGFPVVTMSANVVTRTQMFIKRLMDIVGGVIGSVLALIIMIIVGPIIKIKSPGPIIFKQERVGQNGRRFKMYKIRSMYMDAEERKKEYMDQNRVSDGMMFKLDFDPRIIDNVVLPDGTKKTGIGEFIRKTSLDEFPQFFNVLKGEMSLVGTRPPTVDEWEKYDYHHRARLAIKPGITGMWQTSGRSSITDFEEVVKLDTRYIRNWSLGLDMKILLKTVVGVFRKDGAM